MQNHFATRSQYNDLMFSGHRCVWMFSVHRNLARALISSNGKCFQPFQPVHVGADWWYMLVLWNQLIFVKFRWISIETFIDCLWPFLHLTAFQVGNRSVCDRMGISYVDASAASDEATGCCNGSDVETDKCLEYLAISAKLLMSAYPGKDDEVMWG